MNQTNVITETQTVVVLVAEDFIRPDLQSSIFPFIPDEVRSEHNLGAAGPVSTVSGRHDPLVRDQSAATEPGIVNEEARHPGILVRGGLLASNNLLTWTGQSA